MKITVRMYRHGLGDCFLLIFHPATGRDFYMMIDCGVLQNLEGAPGRLTEVAKHIVETTGGELDLLVMTHEHWDHISGFSYKGPLDVLKGLKIKRVWLSWLDKPGKTIVPTLAAEQNARIAALWNALDYARQPIGAGGQPLGAANRTVWQGIENLLRFTGPREGSGPGGAAGHGAAADGDGAGDRSASFDKIINSRSEAWKFIRSCGEEDTEYLEPGKVVPLPGVDGVRIYVLGPPDDAKSLHSKESTRSEVIYQNPEREPGLTRTLAGDFLAAISAAAGVPADPEISGGSADELQPFQEEYRYQPSPDDQGTADAPYYEFFRKKYGLAEREGDEWRRIDYDWLLQAAELALYMDTYTNNTSLVLAIELVTKGKVGKILLFPGDAQIGNWKSWYRREWQVDEEDGLRRTIKVKELLNQVVFYKVGHHGSHNATLSTQGLVEMTHPDLVAMIPVDEHQALDQGEDGWLMPAPVLYDELQKQALGRVIRDDKGVPSKARCLKFGLSNQGYRRFLKMVDKDPLYIDFTISG